MKPIIEKSQNGYTLENSWNRIELDLDELSFSFYDRNRGELVLSQARFRIDKYGGMVWAEPASKATASHEMIETSHGKGLSFTLTVMPEEGYEPGRILNLILFEKDSAIEFAWGVVNKNDFSIRIKTAELLHEALLFTGQAVSDPRSLKSGAGMEENNVERDWRIDALNGAVISYLTGRGRRTIVAGGLRNAEYVKRVTAREGRLIWKHAPDPVIEKKSDCCFTLTCFDPLGKLVAPGETYMSKDSFYLDYMTDSPFDSLERYGEATAIANDAHPNLYDFPTLCGWMVSTKSLGENRPINNSPGLVEQAQRAAASGFLDYSQLAIRLEPDFYGYPTFGETQQGWWDDEHWARYGSLLEPYGSFEKFCSALKNEGIIPFTYFQSNLPSTDFAAAHPEWMLNNDVSALHMNYAHNHPKVRYDYTDAGFRDHCLAMWRRLREAGVRGIKFDYPETAWARDGGFEDDSFTTSSAYRELFRLCREGLGEEAFIHERILSGESCMKDVPRSDLTAGIVDLQRVWGDSSHFEPEMASRIGLRWYKNRRLFYYYPDGKSFYRNGEELPRYQRQSFLTQIAFLGGRFELGTSFNMMTDEMYYDLSRIYPSLPGAVSPRPADMFLDKAHPEVYSLITDDGDRQVMLVNNDLENTCEIGCPLAGDMLISGALELDSHGEYHAFSFWDQKYLGCLKGDDRLVVSLKPGEAAMVSLRCKKEHPRIISTNRHYLQGSIDVRNAKWSGTSLTGEIDCVAGEPYILTVAANGWTLRSTPAQGKAKSRGKDICDITLLPEETGTIAFDLSFSH